MAEENLEGLDDLDNLLDDDAGAGGDEGFGGELDEFLSDGGDDSGGGGDADEGEGDSELDSFFEDLSTIDDLEVTQEEAPPAEAEEAPMMEEAVPAAVAAAAPMAEPAAAPAAAPREKKKRGFLTRMIMYLILLGVLGGGGYYAYLTFFADVELPWPIVQEEESKGESTLEKLTSQLPFVAKKEPEPPPPPPPPPPPVARPQPPPPVGSGFGVQVATCFFPSCVKSYQALLKRSNRAFSIKTQTTQSEALEIVSRTAFNTRESAEEFARRINREHKLEGQAYATRTGNAYKISMGSFPDLTRANIVKDSLNERYGGEVAFSSFLKTTPHTLRRIVTGRFASRAEARREMRTLRRKDRRFRGAFVVRN